MTDQQSRRRFLGASTLAAAALAGCAGNRPIPTASMAAPAMSGSSSEAAGEPLDASEDLMREHGVLRRVLIVYRVSAVRLRRNPPQLDPASLARAARLFRTFGEDYHERQLEEGIVFPALRQVGGRAASEVDLLVRQHDRGREITDYILATAGRGSMAGEADRLAQALDDMAWMYEAHAAEEDTAIFPVWASTMSAGDRGALAGRFEAIERQQFGSDGFADAVRQITEIEACMGLSLAGFTPPGPGAS